MYPDNGERHGRSLASFNNGVKEAFLHEVSVEKLIGVRILEACKDDADRSKTPAPAGAGGGGGGLRISAMPAPARRRACRGLRVAGQPTNQRERGRVRDSFYLKSIFDCQLQLLSTSVSPLLR